MTSDLPESCATCGWSLIGLFAIWLLPGIYYSLSPAGPRKVIMVGPGPVFEINHIRRFVMTMSGPCLAIQCNVAWQLS